MEHLPYITGPLLKYWYVMRKDYYTKDDETDTLIKPRAGVQARRAGYELKTVFAPTLPMLNDLGKTYGWTSTIYKNAARDFTLERNETVTGRGLPQACHTADIELYIGTPEWQDTHEDYPLPDENGWSQDYGTRKV